MLPEPVPKGDLERHRLAVHPSLLRAAVSPTAIAAAAVGAGIGVADHSVVVAVILAAGGWLGRMSAAVIAGRRRARAAAPRPAELDPWSVPEPWRQLLRDSLAVQSRYDRAVAAWPDGPLRDHLADLQPRVWAQVATLGALARDGAAATGAGSAAQGGLAASAGLTQLSDELRRVQTERHGLPSSATGRRAELERREEALATQLQARHRALQASDAAQDRLRVAVARLDLAITGLLDPDLGDSGVPAPGSTGSGAGALAGAFDGSAGAAAVAEALDGLSDELTSLRAAITETAGVPRAGGAPAPGGAPPDPTTS